MWLWIALGLSVLLNVGLVLVVKAVVNDYNTVLKGSSQTPDQYREYYLSAIKGRTSYVIMLCRNYIEAQYQKALARDSSHQCIYRDEFERARQKLEHEQEHNFLLQ